MLTSINSDIILHVLNSIQILSVENLDKSRFRADYLQISDKIGIKSMQKVLKACYVCTHQPTEL